VQPLQLDVAVPDRKINLLIAVAGLGIGGAEVVIQHLVRAIDRSRFNVTVGCIKAAGPIGEELRRDGFDIQVLSRNGYEEPEYLTFLKMRRLSKLRRIDVIHSHTTDALADAAVCRLLSPRVKLVHTFHFGNYPHLPKRQLQIERLFARFASRLVAVSEVQRSQISATFGLEPSAIGRVWNGVPLAPTHPDSSFRAKIGATDHVLIGTVATMIPQKGLPDLLAVARILRASGRRVRFVVLGDGAMRAELELLRSQLGVEDTVVFAGWVKDASRVAVPEFDIFFQPSLWEAMSIAVLEAMAAGVPVVASRVGENPHIIEHGKDGLLVEPRDVEGMARELTRLVDDVSLRRQLGAAGSDTVSRQFTVSHMARAYERIYEELV
jgi:glycosyltransferase involved in cell wall biosynthesis